MYGIVDIIVLFVFNIYPHTTTTSNLYRHWQDRNALHIFYPKVVVEMSAFTKPKLYYFNIPGKGEAIRLACTYSGYAIEDIRVTRDEFLAMKEVEYASQK